MLTLYSYWRSSSAYRVRIALNLKGLPHALIPVHLLRDGGEHNSAEYRAMNPQGLVPLLVHGDLKIGQSLAIIDYLDSLAPEPRLIPTEPVARARVLSAACTIACETQPLQNLRVLQYLTGPLGHDEAEKLDWARHWIGLGLQAFEAQVAPHAGDCCFGDTPTLADCMLVPQMYNAERFGCELDALPTLRRVVDALRARDAFAAAHPDRQPDAA